uniref:hypothetical protein n=1 Tax=Candidatus Cryptobacteroides bacterium TaxID=3085639 RepID=UPI004028F500
MRDIRGKRIVGYEAACNLKMMGFDWQCTGYYHAMTTDVRRNMSTRTSVMTA